MSFEKRNINATRLCIGLANIGYKSYAAIEDIVDNSVEAKAQNILIKVEVQENKSLTEKGSISKITIIDDGVGMAEDNISKALDIGSDVTYENHSLSKYGLGLKSAGLSLGQRIEIYSKKNGLYTKSNTLDMEEVQSRNEYGVIIEELAESKKRNIIENSGTVIEISNIHSSDTVNHLKKKLIERLGVIYYGFISQDTNERNINISLDINNTTYDLTAKDILFKNECNHNFDEQNYDCKTPFLLLNEEEIKLSNTSEDIPPIKVSLTAFPQSSMEKYPGFSNEEREKIKSYGVSLANSGFYIYRNNRLIRWGDNLGIIDRDLRTLRGRIDIYTEHDELLNVDVSKQNLELPEEFLDQLSLICRIPKDYAKKAYTQCSQKLENNDEKEGEASSSSVLDIFEDDPEIITKTPEEQAEIIKRKNKLISESLQASEKENQDSEIDKKNKETEADIQKIVYKDYFLTTNLWQSKLTPDYGTIVEINKSHPFYQLVLKNLEAASAKRQAIECFIYCLSVGENNTRKNLSGVNYDDIKLVLDNFNRSTSYILQSWTAHNQDIFD